MRKREIFFFLSHLLLHLCVSSTFRLLKILNFITSDINCPFQTDLEAGEESQTWSFCEDDCAQCLVMSLPSTRVAGLELTPLMKQNPLKLVSNTHFPYFTPKKYKYKF